jgi:hypothetical protein
MTARLLHQKLLDLCSRSICRGMRLGKAFEAQRLQHLHYRS